MLKGSLSFAGLQAKINEREQYKNYQVQLEGNSCNCNIDMFTETLFKGSCVTIIYNKSKHFVFGEGPTDGNAYFP